MTSEAGIAFVDIIIYIIVLIVCIIFQVTDRTREDAVIVGDRMAICTLVPGALVRSTENREVLAVVIEGRGFPIIFIVAFGTIGRET